MIISGSGSYTPSSYESVVGGWQQSSMQSLLDYAAMNNARAQVAARQAVAYAVGGTQAQQKDVLYNSRQGAAYQYASQFTEGLYGSGSYVDMMAGYMNITQNAGMYGSSFGRQSSLMYGPGPVADIASKRMFDAAGKYFTDPTTGRNNLTRTQGLSITELSNINQVMAAEGMYAGQDMFTVNKADLRTRTTRAARDLQAQGNTPAADQISAILGDPNISEDGLKTELTNLKDRSTTSGAAKGAISAALNTEFVVDINEGQQSKNMENTTKMAKVLNKLRNLYGEVAETDLFKAGSIFSGSKDPDKMLADMQSFERMARVNGLGDNLEGAARQQAMIAGALSNVFGSTQAGGLMATDVNNNTLVQQRLKMNGQNHLSNEQVAQGVLEDVAGTAGEANMQDAVRLATLAEMSGDPAKIKAARDALTQMKGNIDPAAQSEILSGLRGVVGDKAVNLTYEQQVRYLADKGLGTTVSGMLTETAERSMVRLYEEQATAQGIFGEERDTYLGMVEGLGTARFKDVLKSGKLSEEDIDVLKARGIDTDAATRMLKDKTVKENMQVATSQVLASDEVAMLQGDVAKEEAKILASKEAYKTMLYGDENGDPLKGSSIIQLGLGLLADPNKQLTDKDIRDFAFAENKDLNHFSATADGGLSMTEDQISELVKLNPDIKEEDIRKFMGSKSGLADFQTYMQERGFSAAVGKKGEDGMSRGALFSQEDIDARGQAIKDLAPDQALINLGLGDLTKAGSPEEKKKIAEDILDDMGGTEDFADYLIFDSAADDSPEGREKRKKGALQMKQLLDASGGEADLEDLGDKILKSDDEEYKRLREGLGFGGLSEHVRKNMADDPNKGRQLAGFALSQAGGYKATPEQEALIEELRRAGGENQRVAYMHVENMHVENK